MVSERNVRHTLGEILPMVEGLSIEEKAELVQRLLGDQSGLSVVLGNAPLHGWVIMQINRMSRDELSDMLKVIADRIASEGKSSRG